MKSESNGEIGRDIGRILSVQALRALAAGVVLLMHALNYATAGRPESWLIPVAAVSRQIGHAGVDIFFVVSGFIIANQVVRGGPGVLGFAFRRAVRVYPLFWLTLLAMILIPIYPGKSQATVGWSGVLLFTTAPQHPVAWTLVYEVHFSAVAGLCLLFGREAGKALLAWCLLQAVAVVLRWPNAFFVSPLSLEFCLGVAVVWVRDRYALPRPGLIAAAAVGFMVAAGLLFGGAAFATDQWTRLVLWGAPSAILLWGAINYEVAGGRIPMVAAAIGDMSYSLYMWHVPVLSVAWMIWRNSLGDGWIGLVYVTGCIAASVAIAFVSWHFFERPLIGLSKRASMPPIPLVQSAQTTPSRP